MYFRSRLLVHLAADYFGMFNQLFKEMDENPIYADGGEKHTFTIHWRESVKEEIAWAKRTFSGNNAWITWWLRFVRVVYAESVAPEFYKKELGRMGGDSQALSFSSLRHCKTRLAHYMSIPAAGIKDFRPSSQTFGEVIATLQQMEQDWQKDNGETLSPREEDTVLISFGDGWAWWLLPRHSCTDESRAMGHCGNGPSRDTKQRILSLRKDRGHGRWEPHLTFILEGNGYLGEMKGKNNDKPVARYHPYIIALLKNDIIKGIKGGGYAPENNFTMTDLTEKQQEELYKIKPVLMPLSVYYRTMGVDDSFIAKVGEWFEGEGENPPGWNAEQNMFVIEDFSDVKDLVYTYGNSDAKYVMSVINGDEDYDSNTGATESAKLMYESLSAKEQEKIMRILAAEYPDELREFLEDKGEDLEEEESLLSFLDDGDVLLEFVEEQDSKLFEALYQAYDTGERYGAENQMIEALKNALGDSSFYPEDGEAFWDTKWFWGMTPETLVAQIDSGHSWDDVQESADEIDVSAPYYGWDDYDEKSAHEYFIGEYNLDEHYEEQFGEGSIAAYEEEKNKHKRYIEAMHPVAAQMRKYFKENPVSATDQATWDRAYRDYQGGHYQPFINMVRGVFPDAFSDLPDTASKAASKAARKKSSLLCRE